MGPDSSDSLGITGRRDTLECDFREFCDLHTSKGVFVSFHNAGCFSNADASTRKLKSPDSTHSISVIC